jgi:hypothetical protein
MKPKTMKEPTNPNERIVTSAELESHIAEVKRQGGIVRRMEVVRGCNAVWRLTVEHRPAQPELAPSAVVTLPTNQDATLRRIRAAAAVAWGSQMPPDKSVRRLPFDPFLPRVTAELGACEGTHFQ